MKTCRTCNQTKPADAYRGTRSMCLACEHTRRREWYAAQAIKPHQREDGKAYGLSPSRDDLELVRAIERAHGITAAQKETPCAPTQ